jgi:hypothetical protein
MTITCKICNTTFPKIIPWQHLKQHGTSSAEYKQQYGPTCSEETLAKFSSRTPHNKGKKVTDPQQLQKIKNAIQLRESRYNSGELSRKANSWTPEQKAHFAKKTEQYAINNKKELSERAKRAAATRIEKNISGPFSGKTHSPETREKLKNIAKENNKKRSQEAWEKIKEKCKEYNLTLQSQQSSCIAELKCNHCGHVFLFTKQYFTPSKTFKEMCPKCYPRNTVSSKGEQELYEFVSTLCPNAISNHRENYHDPEIDVFVENKNIGFEYDGLYWHSQEVLEFNNREKTKMFSKKNYFESKNIQLISIFSDEWSTKRSIVESRIRSILNKTTNRIYARKCETREIDSRTASEFCNNTHIMGSARSNVCIGLFYNNELVSVMTFSKSNISRKVFCWELNRFSSKLDTIVVGGASKLFSYFVTKYQPEKVISYSDNRWSSGKLYKNLGFQKISNGTPNYWYVNSTWTKRIHRFTLRKNSNDDPALSEKENRKKQGYGIIWDCGSSKWMWGKQ